MAISTSAARQNAKHDVKFIGDLAGSYLLSSRESETAAGQRVFGCRARSVSVQMAVLAVPVVGAVHEKLALKLDGLGLLRATVARITHDGFAAELHIPAKDVDTFAARIDWLKQRHIKALTDRRDAKRWLPRNPRSVLIVGKAEIACLVIDLSTSGAAVSADIMPKIGQPIVVGGIMGRVVRRIEAGFAIQFLAPQPADTVESLIAPMDAVKRDALRHALSMAENTPPPAPGTE